MRTKRRIPTPAKITFAGDNTYKINMGVSSPTSRRREAHQANTLSKSRREGIEYINGGVEPFG
jgi:hypothetical protein